MLKQTANLNFFTNTFCQVNRFSTDSRHKWGIDFWYTSL